jgi:hypothetical protein
MLSTYRAIVKGDKIIWIDQPPAQLDGVEVQITLLKETNPLSQAERSVIVEKALTQLAKLNPFRDIEDPVQWQREMRQDKELDCVSRGR